MRLKVYRAPSVAQAMARARAELGEEALILNTQRWYDEIELTAALDPASTLDRGHGEMLAFHAVPDRLRGMLAFGNLTERLRRALVFGRLPFDAQPLLMIGPPGAGKTLTVMRLAARLARANQPVVVVTTDDTWEGVNAPLRAYLRSLGLSLTEAFDPPALAHVPRAASTVMLIDSAGSDPYDSAQMGRLRALAEAAGAAIVLVLPAGLDPHETADQAAAYADAGAAFLVVTRFDLARRLGGVLAAADTARLTLTEAGIGQGAADGLVPLTAVFLAGRLLQPEASNHAR